MSVGQERKTCSFCGMDCTHQPRVKDPKGHYYCRICYEALARRRRVRQSAAGETGAADAAATPADATAAGSLDDTQIEEDSPEQDTITAPAPAAPHTTNGQLKQSGAETPPQPPTPPFSTQRMCPQCGTRMEDDAVVCIQCGHDPTGSAEADVFTIDTTDQISPRELMSSTPAISTAMIGLFTSLFFAGDMFPWIGYAYFLLFGGFAFCVIMWTITTAFLDGTREGFLTLFAPGYCVFYVFSVNRDTTLKWVFLAFLIGLLVVAGLYAKIGSDFLELFM